VKSTRYQPTDPFSEALDRVVLKLFGIVTGVQSNVVAPPSPQLSASPMLLGSGRYCQPWVSGIGSGGLTATGPLVVIR
jgi:hypothetical protein